MKLWRHTIFSRLNVLRLPFPSQDNSRPVCLPFGHCLSEMVYSSWMVQETRWLGYIALLQVYFIPNQRRSLTVSYVMLAFCGTRLRPLPTAVHQYLHSA